MIPIFHARYLKFLCEYFGVSSAMVFAIANKESRFDERRKYRYEKNFYKRYILGKNKYKHLPPEVVSASYGYLQIMYTTAQMAGYEEKEGGLDIDLINLYYAVKWIWSLCIRHRFRIRDVISAYNAGSVRKRKIEGKIIYENQEYVDEVYSLYKSYLVNGCNIRGVKIELS